MSETTPQKKESKTLAKTGYGELGGQGMALTMEEVNMPFLNIIQALSKQLKKKKPEYIPEAEEGDMLNSATNTLMPKEIYFLPVAKERAAVEWKPHDQGGGFVGKYPPNSPNAIYAKGNGGKSPAGNDIVDTTYLYGFMFPDKELDLKKARPLIVPFFSTKMKVLRNFNTTISSIESELNFNIPLWANPMVITTEMEEHKAGDSYNFRLNPLRGNNWTENLLELEDDKDKELFMLGHDRKDEFAGLSDKVFDNQMQESDGDPESDTPF